MSLATLERLAGLYNEFEVALWTALALVVLARGLRRAGPERRRHLWAALALVAFAGSDFVEARTGNRWWRPWWLFAWKAACVVVLGGLVLEGWWRGRTRGREPR